LSIRQLYRFISRKRFTLPLRDVAILMLQTGMRCGEIYRTKRNEVFLDKGFLKVTKGKTKASFRQVHLTHKASGVLASLMQSFKSENLFPQNDEDFSAATQTIDQDAHSGNGTLEDEFPALRLPSYVCQSSG